MTLQRKAPMRRVNGKRLAARKLAQFGSAARARWWWVLPCVCEGLHPKCSGGLSERSHVVSRGAGGLAADIVPKSRGCHLEWGQSREDYCAVLGITYDRMRELAAEYATQGPDAPYQETP